MTNILSRLEIQKKGPLIRSFIFIHKSLNLKMAEVVVTLSPIHRTKDDSIISQR